MKYNSMKCKAMPLGTYTNNFVYKRATHGLEAMKEEQDLGVLISQTMAGVVQL